jgi:hypothetical protein
VDNINVMSLFVDFCVIKQIERNNKNYLNKIFAATSKKASEGRIYGIKPKDGKNQWDSSAILYFLSKTSGSRILATVKGFDSSQSALILSLIDKSNLQDVASSMKSEGVVDGASENTH